jgi:D-galactosamine 6-phosphate deaminase/isomerase
MVEVVMKPVPPTQSVDELLTSLAPTGEIGRLLRPRREEQLARGYGHTLNEICQQPVTWRGTAALVRSRAGELGRCLEGMSAVVLTGSGSSLYAGECVAPCLQGTLRIPTTAVPGGIILTHPELCLPPSGSYLVVSIARSGNSPESRGVVDFLLESQPRVRHLLVTCNVEGALATAYRGVRGVETLVLDRRTNDQSLVMTSSFTNLVLAARGLALSVSREYEERVDRLAGAAADVLRLRSDDVAKVAQSGFGSVVYLASGCRLGSAREAALKMLEMNGGDVWTFAESYLGLRHGPMSAMRPDTLLVAFLSADPVVRAYEVDLLRELRRKELGARRLIVGSGVPPDLAPDAGDVIVDTGPNGADEDLTLIDTLVGQLLAFFRCVCAGYRPDSPSQDGVITRVVSSFEIHRRNGPR